MRESWEMPKNPQEALLEGSELLGPMFAKHEFRFAQLGKGHGSGGRFAFAEFRKGDRRIEFHVRYNLGMVTYHLGSESISHEEYMCSVLGKPNLSRYPGFSSDILEAFRDLREDLQNHGIEFLEGTDAEFLARIKDARARWANRPKLPQ